MSRRARRRELARALKYADAYTLPEGEDWPELGDEDDQDGMPPWPAAGPHIEDDDPAAA